MKHCPAILLLVCLMLSVEAAVDNRYGSFIEAYTKGKRQPGKEHYDAWNSCQTDCFKTETFKTKSKGLKRYQFFECCQWPCRVELRKVNPSIMMGATGPVKTKPTYCDWS